MRDVMGRMVLRLLEPLTKISGSCVQQVPVALTRSLSEVILSGESCVCKAVHSAMLSLAH